MPGGHQSHRDDDRHAASQETPPPLSDELPPNILGQVVAETASSLAQAEEADPTLKAAMVEVARRFIGQPITVDPIGTALLEAILRGQFAFLAERPALLAKTARTVAASLLADPAARLRVEHLWAKLSEEAA
jgi:hypothetical protein